MHDINIIEEKAKNLSEYLDIAAVYKDANKGPVEQDVYAAIVGVYANMRLMNQLLLQTVELFKDLVEKP